MHSTTKKSLKILFVAAEAAPLIKVGGLGDYTASLPKALLEQNNNADSSLDIRIMLPYTTLIDPAYLNNNKYFTLTSKYNGIINTFEVFSTQVNSISYYILRNLNPEIQHAYVYSSDPVSDAEKFTSFSLACLDLMKAIGWEADIIQANDWQTGVLCSALKQVESKMQKKCIFVIHNLPYMGAGAEPVLKKYGIPSVQTKEVPRWGKHLPLVTGIFNADEVITVSPTYAKEILTSSFGNGLESFLKSQEEKLIGILNGIDQTLWDPAADPLIFQKFDSEHLELRKKNKEYLQKSFSLECKQDIPLFVMVSRLDRQKGIDLLAKTLRTMKQKTWQTIILGTGSQDQEMLTSKLEDDFLKNVRVINRFDHTLSHQLFAGGDFFIMPSLYEPCGTSQMIAMRYGCIPIAHAVGGLVDSIIDVDDQRTGYLFFKPDTGSFSDAINRARDEYQNPVEWSKIQKRAMAHDFSWKNSAKKYLKVYKKILGK